MDKVELLKKHTGMLAEHFDSVQIICTSLRPDGLTERFHAGSGNFYARQGSVQAWLEHDKSDQLATAIGQQIKKDEDD